MFRLALSLNLTEVACRDAPSENEYKENSWG